MPFSRETPRDRRDRIEASGESSAPNPILNDDTAAKGQGHAATPAGRKVGCEDEDGMLRVHPESETCEVCAPPAALDREALVRAKAEGAREALEQAASMADEAIKAYLDSQTTEDEAGYPPFHLALLAQRLRARAI